MIVSPVVLAILDGFGITRNRRGNAVRDAYTPSLDHLFAFHPSLALQASGFPVGMIWGEAGNSEAGHAAIGSGRILYHRLPRILRDIRSGAFFENPVLTGAVAHAQRNRSQLHFVGLISTATTHSYLEHLWALFELAKQRGAEATLHCFTDGVDSSPRQAARLLQWIRRRILAGGYAIRLGTLIGRYFAMDTSASWDRVERAYRALTGQGELAEADLLQHLADAYARGVTDEFVTPAVSPAAGRIACIRPGDAVIFFNFREDAAQEMLSAFTQQDFDGFNREPLQNLYVATFTAHAKELPVGVAFPETPAVNCLSETLSRHGVKQLKIAPMEKYAHLTCFFNGGREEVFPFERRVLLPQNPQTDGEKPAGSGADNMGEEIVRAVERGADEFILANFSGADAVAHTGEYRATIRAIEAIDHAVGRLYAAIAHRRGALLITSDHGGVEECFNIRTGEEKTGHSDNPVPFVFVTARNRFKAMRTEEEIQRRFAQPMGVLADVAPTVLELLNVKKPPEMTGQSLLGFL